MIRDMTKHEARREARNRLDSMKKSVREEAARLARTVLLSTPQWLESRTLLTYLAFGTELNTDGLVHSALDEGRSVAVPRVLGTEIRFFHIAGLDNDFVPGPYGIREPDPAAPPWEFSSAEPTLVLVPGLAFTPEGRRLGRGGGYYDRFILLLRTMAGERGVNPPLFWGYAYECQVTSGIPAEAHDASLDALVTEKGIRRFL